MHALTISNILPVFQIQYHIIQHILNYILALNFIAWPNKFYDDLNEKLEI